MALKHYMFDETEKLAIRKCLLQWYHINKRDLPWRKCKDIQCNKNDYAYSVWVSEIMLQQTRVATVVDYYNRWMSKWPTIKDLAEATQEEVNFVWSGLGYYSRGRRLRESACIVANEFAGQIPTNSASLLKFPGIGRYTASAIASIVFNEPVGVLDGNVIRVLSRLKAIGGNIANKEVVEHLWSLSHDLVAPNQPGDFNQALMELGSLVCTPKNPQCCSCPLNTNCKAFIEAKKFKQPRKNKGINNGKDFKVKDSEVNSQPDVCADIENCDFLAHQNYDVELGVENYPYKSRKKTPREELVLVVIIEIEDSKIVDFTSLKFLVSKRPDSGLLAGLWEFPNEIVIDKSSSENRKKRKYSAEEVDIHAFRNYRERCLKFINAIFSSKLKYEIVSLKYLGEHVHKFSHIKQNNLVYHATISFSKNEPNFPNFDNCYKWVSISEFQKLAKSSLTSQLFKLFSKSRTGSVDKTKQTNILSFFSKKDSTKH